MAVVEHPALSPYLNPIENLGGVLVCSVYRDGCRFMSKYDLKSVILSEWENIGLDYLKKLVDSMPDRCFEIVGRKGANPSFREQELRRIHNAIKDFIQRG